MVNQQRVEKKLPLLLTDGPWYSSELDRNIYRLQKFKRVAPEKYVSHRNNILNELDNLKRDMDSFSKNGKNGKT